MRSLTLPARGIFGKCLVSSVRALAFSQAFKKVALIPVRAAFLIFGQCLYAQLAARSTRCPLPAKSISPSGPSQAIGFGCKIR